MCHFNEVEVNEQWETRNLFYILRETKIKILIHYLLYSIQFLFFLYCSISNYRPTGRFINMTVYRHCEALPRIFAGTNPVFLLVHIVFFRYTFTASICINM